MFTGATVVMNLLLDSGLNPLITIPCLLLLGALVVSKGWDKE